MSKYIIGKLPRRVRNISFAVGAQSVVAAAASRLTLYIRRALSCCARI